MHTKNKKKNELNYTVPWFYLVPWQLLNRKHFNRMEITVCGHWMGWNYRQTTIFYVWITELQTILYISDEGAGFGAL